VDHLCRSFEATEATDVTRSTRGHPKHPNPACVAKCAYPPQLSHTSTLFLRQMEQSLNDHEQLNPSNKRPRLISEERLYVPQDSTEERLSILQGIIGSGVNVSTLKTLLMVADGDVERAINFFYMAPYSSWSTANVEPFGALPDIWAPGPVEFRDSGTRFFALVTLAKLRPIVPGMLGAGKTTLCIQMYDKDSASSAWVLEDIYNTTLRIGCLRTLEQLIHSSNLPCRAGPLVGIMAALGLEMLKQRGQPASPRDVGHLLFSHINDQGFLITSVHAFWLSVTTADEKGEQFRLGDFDGVITCDPLLEED